MQLVFPDGYFKDEVREGFLVVEKMKRAWAAQMQVVEEFREICDRHGLSWFAGWGTMLGAVRHKGFIPWDDDVDIFMPRPDYDKFIHKYIYELPKHYAFLNIYNTPDYKHYLTRLVNHSSIDYTPEMMEKYHGCPYACGIDLVPIDYIPRNEDNLKVYNTLIELTSKGAETIAEGIMDYQEEKKYVSMVEKAVGRKLDRSRPIPQQLRQMAESICSMYGPKDSDSMGIGVRQFEQPKYNVPKECYESAIKIPFEDVIDMSVPKGYHEILVSIYGEGYMTPIKYVDHDYPFYKKQEEEKKRNSIRISDYYSEKDVSMSKFLDGLKIHEDAKLPDFDNGKKIWERVKTRILTRDKASTVYEMGITDADKRRLLALFDISREIVKLCKSDEEMELFRDHLSILQESVISIGESIEALLEEGADPVPLLENICEEAYMLSMGESYGQGADLSIIDDLIERACQTVSGFHKKLNVLFLPYKYSMWDSLESIWQAANDDCDTQAVVMPIPYVERNEKGGAGIEFYEVDKFSGKVPVVLCDQYDMEGERPDAIFFHNPYDGANYVTSVFPQYYSSELKKYTDTLVYVPYCMFCPQGISPVNTQVPGVIHADLCMLQSDFIRDEFIKYHRQFLCENNLEPLTKGLDKKFIALGSPKKDRMVRELKSTHDIPKEWMEMIKEGGIVKKVVFWDTHLNQCMKNNSDEFEKKLNSVMDYFEDRSDTILWWRPHPITRHTIKTANPEFKDRYERIVERARISKHIIYDDLDDAYMGLSLSDCYYGGNNSSLSYMYENTGRPIFYTDYSGATK